MPPPSSIAISVNNEDGHCCRRHQPLPQLTRTMAITPAAIDQRRHCHLHHCIIIVVDGGGGKDTTTTTTIDLHCHTTAIGSVLPQPPTRTTATHALIALALTLPWMRIGWRGGGLTATPFNLYPTSILNKFKVILCSTSILNILKVIEHLQLW